MMKKINFIITLVVVLIASGLSAQNVGIDEPNPSEKLDVNGRIVAKGYKNTILTAEGTNNITMGVTNIWTDVPDLSLTFTLDEATTVISSFSMSLRHPGSNSLATLRLEIDGAAYSPTLQRFETGEYHTLTNQNTMELGAGSHTIKVQYYINTTAPLFNNPDPFQERKLQVLIFGSN